MRRPLTYYRGFRRRVWRAAGAGRARPLVASTSLVSIPITTMDSSCRCPSIAPSGSRCAGARIVHVHVRSLDFDTPGDFSLERLERGPASWIEYVKGVAWAMVEAGHRLYGWEGVLAGDVPVGAGLSSSAALEIAVARAFAALSEIPWEPGPMALIGQRAENGWVGMNCGIMDQMISAAGLAGHAL